MSEHAILLFDGVCNVCNDSVQFIIERDRAGYFQFAPLQSDFARELLARFGLPVDAMDTMVLVEGDRVWTHSDAAVEMVRRLPGAWPLLAGFGLLPRALRDRAYAWLVRNRYRWFGKRDTCMVPTPELKARFLA